MEQTQSEKRKAILAYVYAEKENFDKILDELALLAGSADYEVVGKITQKRDRPDKSYYLGVGKLEELKKAVISLDADIVIFDNDLTGSQFNNLEKYLGADVIDRSTVILEIFEKHAVSMEGKLQVELARKKHSLPRVLGQGFALSRQGGGGGGAAGARRGAGEQKSELDKRTIRSEIRSLEERIEKLSKERQLRREKRQKNNIKQVCIVGYTNAGKSTLMNRLTKANVLVENKLFATLDPTTKKLWLAPKKEFLITDTVGFISRLPHEFIDAFAGTLEETKYADLILHVVNGLEDDMLAQFDVVNDVLRKIGAEDIPVITVINKCENGTPAVIPADDEHVVFISALTGEGISELKDKISLSLFGESHIWE